MKKERVIERFNKRNQILLNILKLDAKESENINFILDNILSQYNLQDKKEVLYTIIKELLINAIKANIKYIYFQERGIDREDPEEHNEGIKELSKILRKENIEKYVEKFKKQGLKVELLIKKNGNKLIFKVKNNLKLSKVEEERIKEKFELSKKYNSLVEFYLDNQDALSEGAGLGLILILILIREHGLSEENFYITTNKEEETEAVLNIPLTNSHN